MATRCQGSPSVPTLAKIDVIDDNDGIIKPGNPKCMPYSN